jgi:head-tail adaptor
MAVKAGHLRERFAFDVRSAGADDGYGNVLQAWAQVFTCAAGMTPLRRGEAVQAARLSGVQPFILQVRASSDSRAVTTAWRARDTRTGTAYNIRTVEPSADRSMIEMVVEAGVAVG